MVWRSSAGTIVAIGALLRFWHLDLKPLHHDEGVNGYFLLRLAREAVYRYDPANYHGPTLPYFTVAATRLIGMTTSIIRSVTAIFGIGVILLVLALAPAIGRRAALAGAALLAISPAAVYFSRYFIHETLLVFFTLGLVVAFERFITTRHAAWAIIAAISAALVFATKETFVISFAVLGGAAAIAWFVRRRPALQEETTLPKWRMAAIGVASLAAFGGVAILFYSSFFDWMPGVRASLETLKIWAKTGHTEHVHSIATYLVWLAKGESAILLFAVIGTLIAIRERAGGFGIFCVIWGWGLWAAYSLISYKTPWLALNFIVPLAIAAGCAVDRLTRAQTGQVLAIAAVGALMLPGALQCIDVNFIRYDDEAIPYVYAPTARGWLRIIDDIETFADQNGTKTRTGVAVMYPEYWPLPWYLREYRSVGYFGKIVPTSVPLVIVRASEEATALNTLGTTYTRLGIYRQRNGLDVVLLARRGTPHPARVVASF